MYRKEGLEGGKGGFAGWARSASDEGGGKPAPTGGRGREALGEWGRGQCWIPDPVFTEGRLFAGTTEVGAWE